MRIANLTALTVFVADQVLKIIVVWWLNLAERGEIDVIPPLLNFRMAWNDAEILRWGLIAVALAISLWVWLWVRRDAPSAGTQVLAGLLIGGALGNVVDRVLYGAVADFLNMSCCGIENPFAFNVADICIFLGAIGLAIFAGKEKPPHGRAGNSP